MLNYFQKVASSKKDAALQSFLAGVDLEAPSDECYRHLITLVREGTLDEELIDRSVQRILRTELSRPGTRVKKGEMPSRYILMT